MAKIKKQNSWWKTGGFIAAIAFLLLGILIVISNVFSFRMAISSHAWPVTKGRVVDVDLIKNETVDPEQEQHYMYSVFVKFEYAVNGNKYSITNVVSSSTSSFVTSVAEKQYPVGKMVDIHYNPDNPRQFVLSTGLSWIDLKLMIFGILITVISALCLLYEIRKMKSRGTVTNENKSK